MYHVISLSFCISQFSSCIAINNRTNVQLSVATPVNVVKPRAIDSQRDVTVVIAESGSIGSLKMIRLPATLTSSYRRQLSLWLWPSSP